MNYKDYEKLEKERIERNIGYANQGVIFMDIRRAYIEEGTRIGEGTFIYPDVILEGNVSIGKDCRIGPSTRIKDSNIGDSDVGRNVNLGCGVVFVNYDGTNKHRSVVEDGAFIGCNTNLVSPVTVEKGAYIAAGSTVTRKVPADSLLIARAREEIKEGWASRSGLLKKNK